METISPAPPAWTLLRAEGLLAAMIYIASTPTITTQDSNTNPVFTHKAWEVLRNVQSQLEDIRYRLAYTMHLACPDNNLVESFVNPTSFYEAAVSGFHNTLLGHPPTALGEIVALCAMSNVASCYLYSVGNQISFPHSFDFGLWRNTIDNHEHRKLFDDLIQATFQEPCLIDPMLDSFPTLMGANDSLQLAFPEPQYSNGISNGALDFWEVDPTTPIPVLTSHNGYFNPTVNGCGSTSTPAPDQLSLQGSPIIANLTRFLECGKLPLILSSLSNRGAMANNWHPIGISKPAESGDAHRIKRLYMQLLQDDGCLEDPAIQGILSVVDRFAELGYLQTATEMQDYLQLLGKGLLPPDKIYLDFILSVRDSMAETENRISSSKKVPCDFCGKVFTRRTNMQRHVGRKHPGLSGNSTPTVTGSPVLTVP